MLRAAAPILAPEMTSMVADRPLRALCPHLVVPSHQRRGITVVSVPVSVGHNGSANDVDAGHERPENTGNLKVSFEERNNWRDQRLYRGMPVVLRATYLVRTARFPGWLAASLFRQVVGRHAASSQRSVGQPNWTPASVRRRRCAISCGPGISSSSMSSAFRA